MAEIIDAEQSSSNDHHNRKPSRILKRKRKGKAKATAATQTDIEDNDFIGLSSESESEGSECVDITNEEVSFLYLIIHIIDILFIARQ